MNTLSKKIQYILSAFAVIFLLALIIQVWNIFNVKEQSNKRALNEITRKWESLGNKLDKDFASLKIIGESIAGKLTVGPIKKEYLHTIIKNAMEENPDVYGLGVAFEPDFYGPGTNLYAPYYIRGETGLEYRAIEKSYDYTSDIEDAKWYQDTKKINAGAWMETLFGKASGTLVPLYTVPFFTPSGNNGKKFSGVVLIDFLLDYKKKVMDEFGLEQTGDSYIISKEGRFLVHPSSEIVFQKKTLSQLAEETRRDDLRQLWDKIETAKGGIFNSKSILTAEPAILYLKAIPAIGWSIIAVFARDEIEINRTPQKRCTLGVIISGCLFLTILCALLFRVYYRKTRALWMLSIAFSLILCAGIIAVWSFDCIATRDIMKGRIHITDKKTLKNFLDKNWGGEPLIQIPTGIFIQSLEFRSAKDVFITGYIWQKYSKNLHANISRGFVLCEAIDPKIEKIYEIEYPNENEITVGWHFESVLRQYFDYKWYPMDKKDVWIRMEHKDFNKPTILVPDLDSYKMISPESLPGIETNIVIPGLTLKCSFFSYVFQNYNTNFGLQEFAEEAFPELYFTVIVNRKFLDPFIHFLLPALVVAFIIFSLLLISTYQKVKIGKSGYSSSFILHAAAGLIFSTLIAHSQLRTTIEVDYLIYLDYFYIILYPLILFLIFNSIIVSSGTPNRFFQFRDNLLPKLLFWPVVTLFLFALTVVMAYK